MYTYIFTFYYIYINTLSKQKTIYYYNHLHSTIFILIPLQIMSEKTGKSNLHSTIFILIQIEQELLETK